MAIGESKADIGDDYIHVKYDPMGNCIWRQNYIDSTQTTTAIYALRRLEEKSRIKTVIINCRQKRTFYEIRFLIEEGEIARQDCLAAYAARLCSGFCTRYIDGRKAVGY